MANEISNKKFTIAGTSNFEGVRTFRFANGDLDARANTLRHNGHTAVKLAELPKAMTKVEAIAFLTKKGTRAILPTRSPDKKRKSPIQLMGEAMGRGEKVSAEA
jgi:hypothetical protein